MDRWKGIVKVSLHNDNRDAFFKVAVSLLLCPTSKALAVPSTNVIFFNGDRVKGTGSSVIERLSNSKNIVEILAPKLGATSNILVVEASTFNGPFAIYKEYIPNVNSHGEPMRYDAHGFPASSCIVELLRKIINQVNSSSPSNKNESTTSPLPSPKTAIFGFSKGGTVVNQLVAELAHFNEACSYKPYAESLYEAENGVFPSSLGSFLLSISQIHYVDVGLNCRGAYLTDEAVINEVVKLMVTHNSSLRFILHGTPRQWGDAGRPWIRREKDELLRALRMAADRCEGRLRVVERLYFADMKPSLQMHFEVIESMDVS